MCTVSIFTVIEYYFCSNCYNKDYKSHELWGQVFQLAKQDTVLCHTFGLINIQEIKRVWSFPYELLFSQLDYM